MTDVKLALRGLRGESFADVARRVGEFGGLPVSATATDAEVLNLLEDRVGEVVAAGGFTVVAPVRAATTANITLSGAQTIDGVAVVATNRVLVKNQSSAAANGVYVAAAGAWSRATDFDQTAEAVQGACVIVSEGTTQAGSAWVLTTADPVTVGTTAQTWTQFRDLSAFAKKVSPVFSGSPDFLLGSGGHVVITSETAAPSSPVGLVHLQNEDAFQVGLNINCYWTGTTADPYVNNDTTLFVTHSDIVSNSLNKSWSVSASNAYRNIPVGVTDSGEAVGVLGWASSVAAAGYTHAGTLAAQCGVRGRAGFQGAGSASTAVVQNAVGIDGEIVADSTGATIELAIAVRATSPGGVGVVEENIAVYANALNGTTSNYSFFGQNGAMFNSDPIVSDDYVRAVKYLVNGNTLVDADGTNHRFYRVSGDIWLYAGTTEVLGRHDTWRFGNQALNVDYLKMGAAGIEMTLPTYADNAAAVSGGKAVNTLYKTATGEVRIVV